MKNLELTPDQQLRLAVVKSITNADKAREAYNFIMEGAEKGKPEEAEPEIRVPENYTLRQANTEGRPYVVFVLDPQSGTHIPADQWLKREDKTSANWVGIVDENGVFFYLHKKELAGGKDVKWDEAKKLAEEAGGNSLGRRKWWCDVYDAIHTAKLNDVLKEIGGDPIAQKWYWTADKDTDQSTSTGAWVFSATSGYLTYNYFRVVAVGARVFRAF